VRQRTASGVAQVCNPTKILNHALRSTTKSPRKRKGNPQFLWLMGWLWFIFDDARARGASSAADQHFRKHIERKLCGLIKGSSIPSFFVSPDYRYGGDYRFPQSEWERSYVLGWYEYRLMGLATVRNGSTVQWTADIAIVDKLGWERQMYGDIYSDLFGKIFLDFPAIQLGDLANDATDVIFGVSREFFRGQHQISGEANCCR
jgi:hypothetical protein